MYPEQSNPAWYDVRTPESLADFVGYYFQSSGTRPYLEAVFTSIEQSPTRLNNPLYLPFAARTMLMAAEYQYPGVSGHEKRHIRHRWQRNFMSPVHLLALGIYLASDTIRQFEQKAILINDWNKSDNERTRQDFDILLTSWVRPRIPFPETDGFLFDFPPPKHVFGGRLDALPVLIPDIAFLRRVSRIPLTGDQADTIPVGAFRSRILKPTQRYYFTGYDPDLVTDLFLNDPATW